MFAPSSVRPVANSREHSHPLLAMGSIKERGCCNEPCDGRSVAIPIISRDTREFDCARLMPASSRSTSSLQIMPYPLVIFDLDGTLADSLPWFLRNVNSVADKFSFRRVAEEDIEVLRGLGSREILRRLEVRLWKLPGIRAAHATAESRASGQHRTIPRRRHDAARTRGWRRAHGPCQFGQRSQC